MTHIIIGLSGGVDSSVSALLLKKAGFQVTGVFMRNWDQSEPASACTALRDLEMAKACADQLEIPFKVWDFSQEYWDEVFSFFLSEYRNGRTPNPDILCNKAIKFKCFLDAAKSIGADKIATGHYARISQREDGLFYLLKGLDPFKDQSYFLYTLQQTQLSHSIFPIGSYTKQAVRKMAIEHQLCTAHQKESMGICFIGPKHFRNFLKKYLPAQPGHIVDPEGHFLGTHDGCIYYTLGQRKGLYLGGKKGKAQAPWYVLNKDIEHNLLIVTQDPNHPDIFSIQAILTDLSWVNEAPSQQQPIQARIRHQHNPVDCFFDSETALISFQEPQKHLAPGQSIVFYDQEICLGGGIILKTNK